MTDPDRPIPEDSPDSRPEGDGSAGAEGAAGHDAAAHGATSHGAPGTHGYREVTLAAMIFAVVIGVVMNAAITYAGLKIGFTIGGSAIAAILGFGILRGVLRKGSILETNVAQTVASAVNTSNSGVIFTVPVLFLIGYSLSPARLDFWLILLACIGGALLGTAFIIPLRKQMIDIERLRFPSPTGVALILKSPGAGAAKATVLLLGILLGAAIYLPSGLPAITVNAEVDELPALVERGRITPAQAAQTRTLADWIAKGEAPEAVRTLGALLARGDDSTAEVEAFRAAHPDLVASDALALAVARIAAGEATWDELRDAKYGWAAAPLPGYADLDLRLPAEADPAADAAGAAALTRRVDRDRDGRPDQVLTDATIDVGRVIGLPDEIQLVFAIAPFALGAGYITGRAGLFVLAGGILAFFVLNPIAYNFGWMPATVHADQAPGYGFGAFNRPLGIGLLLGGALMGVIASLPAIREALRSIAGAAKLRGGRDELGIGTLVVAVIGGVVFLFVAADVMGGRPINATCPVTHVAIGDDVEPAEYGGFAIGFATPEAAAEWSGWNDEQRDAYLDEIDAHPGLLAGLPVHVRNGIIAIVGALWIWFAGIIIAQCAGMTDWSPISGMALLTVVLIMLLAGTGAVVASVLIGAALCVAITLAADMMGDLKTGHLVGAIPRRQQIAELSVVWIGPAVCLLTLMLIVQVNMEQVGVPLGPGTPTVAPQAQALQAVIVGVQGGQMPYALYGVGAGLGALLGLGAFSGLGVLVGLSMYLPFMYIATYGVGCLINMAVARVKGRSWAEEWGVPFAAGLVVGESLLALAINIVVLLR